MMPRVDPPPARRVTVWVPSTEPTHSAVVIAGYLERILALEGYDVRSQRGRDVDRRPDAVEDGVHLSLHNAFDLPEAPQDPEGRVRGPNDRSVHYWAYLYHEQRDMAPEVVRKLDGYERLFFVSTFCADAYRRSGGMQAALVCPHGCDASVFSPAPETDRLFRESFVFLTVGQQQPRKASLTLARCFLDAFSPADPVRLVIKDGCPWAVSGTTQALRLLAEGPGRGRIRYITGHLPPDALAALYRTADAFVLPTRVEGFGIPLLEAKFTALPVMTTAYGGQADFCAPDDTLLLPYTLVAKPADGRKPTRTEDVWADPDPDALIAAMRRLVHDPDRGRVMGALGRERTMGMTWEAGLAPLLAALRSIA